MRGLFVELRCPDHGLERFTIKIIRRANIPSYELKPIFRSRPVYELSCIIIGRNVDEKLVQEYFVNYMRQKGLHDKLVKFKII